MTKTIIAFDTETTGLIKPKENNLDEQPEIIELYMLKAEFNDETGEFKTIGEYETYLKPKKPVSAEITKITGITNEDVSDAPTFVDVWQEVAKFMVGTDILTAHNLKYDINMLANESLRIDRVLNFPWPPRQICTVQSSKHYEGYRLNLTKLHTYLFDKAFEDAHRSRADVAAQFDCFKEMVLRGDIIL